MSQARMTLGKILIYPSTLRKLADRAEIEAAGSPAQQRNRLLEAARKMRLKADHDEATGELTEVRSEPVDGDPHAQVMSIDLDGWIASSSNKASERAAEVRNISRRIALRWRGH